MVKIYGEAQTRIDAKEGEEFAIELPTALGYQWQLDPGDLPGVRLIEQRELQPRGPGIGAPALQRFLFRAVARGSLDVSLTNKRSWEAEPEKRCVFHVRVR